MEGLTVRYGSREVVRDLSHRLHAGTWLCLIGPNGAGKTSVLRAVAGLVAHDGRVTLDGTPVGRLSRRQLARLVASVPQQPVIPADMSVEDYALLGRTAYIPHFGVERRSDRDVVARALERLDLTGLAGRPLGTLSGGERQRAVLARALAQEAPVLLLDEPTSALDIGHQQHVLELVDGLRREQRLTVLSAMHDLTLAGQFADELLLLRDGRAVAWGDARTVLSEPLLGEHYGASLRVVLDTEGGVVIIPTRPARTPVT
jgi:cobalamin transport system ATP-binding protein